jgi:hypothetical protein
MTTSNKTLEAAIKIYKAPQLLSSRPSTGTSFSKQNTHNKSSL